MKKLGGGREISTEECIEIARQQGDTKSRSCWRNISKRAAGTSLASRPIRDVDNSQTQRRITMTEKPVYTKLAIAGTWRSCSTPPMSEAVLNDLFDFLAERLRLSETKSWRDALIKVVAWGNEPVSDYCGASGFYWQDGEPRFHLGMHELNRTREFCQAHGLDEVAILSWLTENDAHCDCEALRLVTSALMDIRTDEEIAVIEAIRKGEL
jgi:hypothetical protein